ncbi:MAG: class I SAM-dependent methyltransferase [Candidatus Saccharimonadales bacterium]
MSEIRREKKGDRLEITPDIDAALQYLSALNADRRRELYKFAYPSRNIWKEIVAELKLRGDLQGTESILDIGTGTGVFIEELLASNHRGAIIGADLYIHQFQPAHQKLKERAERGELSRGVGFIRTDAQNMIEIPDNHYDVASSLFLIYHLSYPAQHILEISRVVKPGGLFVVSTRDPDNLFNLWHYAGEAAGAIGAKQHEPFYRQCDIETTKNLLYPFEDIYSDTQDSELLVPLDINPGDRRGLSMYRDAFLSLSDSLIDSTTGQPIDENKIRDVEAYFENQIAPELEAFSVINLDPYGRPSIQDRVHQAYFICRNIK